MYQSRLLLYADILGWKDAIKTRGDDPLILKAVEAVHMHAETHNEHFRQTLLSRDGKGITVFRKALEVHFGAFSDHFVYSMPQEFGPRILTTASNLVRALLQMGWLTRGAIVVGPLYHKDNAIFGPALLHAVEMEEKQSVYPRILISDDVLKLLDEWELDDRHKTHIKDQFDRVVVNPFAVPFVTTGGDQDIALRSLVQLNYGFSEIKPMLDQQIESHTTASRLRQAEKWAYMRSFITGPVFSESPELANYW